MEKSINNFKYEDIQNNKKYQKAVELAKEKENAKVWEKVNKNYMGGIAQTFWFLAISIGVTMGSDGEAVGIFLFYTPIWLISILTLRKRKRVAFEEEMQKTLEERGNNGVLNYSDILNIFLEKKGKLELLGKTFYIKHNEITNSIKREYFGDVLISLEEDKNKIYIVNEKELYEKEFVISDIVSFKRISPEGLGDVKGGVDHHSDMSNIVNAENRANRLRAEAKISSVTSRTGASNLHDNIRADKAALQAKKERDNLNNKIEQEEKRLKDELGIRLLEFRDGDHLLISHLDDNTLKDLERMIEAQ